MGNPEDRFSRDKVQIETDQNDLGESADCYFLIQLPSCPGF